MECLVINQNKIKVTLTSSEIKKYGLRFPLDTPLTSVAGLYWDIIDDVLKRQEAFSFAERLLVQSYAVESGAELFVTKLGKSCDSTEKSALKSQNSLILAVRGGMFPFYDIDELIDAVLHTASFECCKSSLYYSDDGVYYLFCEERTLLGVCSYVYRMSEFSKPMPPIMNSYIIEHSDIIISKNAISVIKEVFG